MGFVELSQDELYAVDGGGILGDLVNEIPKAYDAAKSFVKGFADGWNSVK